MATHSSIRSWRMDRGALAGYGPWSHKELDTSERLSTYSDKGEAPDSSILV